MSTGSSQVICRKDARVGAALVGLAGRMLESAAEAEAGGGAGVVAHSRADRCQGSRCARIAGDIGQQRHIVAGLDPVTPNGCGDRRSECCDTASSAALR
jgi:hypothetical protein